MGPQEEGVTHPATPLGVIGLGIQRTSEEAIFGSRPISNEQPMRETHASGRSDCRIWNHSNQGRAQPSDLDRR